jgi:hypothetical protein
MLFEFDPCKRTYRKQKFIMDQVIDVTSTTNKQLPGQVGLPAGKVNQLNSHKIKLPEGQQEPLRIL